MPCGLCCPSYDNGCTAKAGVSDLESPEKSPARKEAVNIVPELLNASD